MALPRLSSKYRLFCIYLENCIAEYPVINSIDIDYLNCIDLKVYDHLEHHSLITFILLKRL